MGIDFAVDFDKAVKEVLASGGRIIFKHRYNIDVDKYSWVRDFVRDQELRKEIDRLQKEIAATQQSLIDRDELQAMFDAGVEQLKQGFLELLRDHLVEAQKRECPVIGGLHSFGVISNRLPLMTVSLASPEDIGNIIAGLPRGVKQKEIEATVEGLRKQIAKCNETIERELSPRERWFHFDTGKPQPYPVGCRWTKFVSDWKTVVARFDGKVDIEGVALVTEEEFTAFHMLELDRVRKMPPLRDPWTR